MVKQKLLVANRGEIACRVFQTAREMGLETVALYTEADLEARHLTYADQILKVESYLDSKAIAKIAKENQVTLVHPGYGFLSERPVFVEAVEKAGITFLGPRSETMQTLGGKIEAKRLAEKLSIPTLPWAIVLENEDILQKAKPIGFPLLLKAAAGGGGKGMRRVDQAKDLKEAAQSASREALNAFGDGALFLEKLLVDPRHIEVQVFGDGKGKACHLFERECSAQRRHQKVIEEAPAYGLIPKTREGLLACAVKLSESVRYRSAGTIEFLVDQEGKFYFLEMNTRLQVEHPVSECITGVDLVRAQIELGLGTQSDQNLFALHLDRPRGHAIEARLYAENPYQGFMPTPGKIEFLKWPLGAGIRVDSGIEEHQTITTSFDPLLAKIIVHAPDRRHAMNRLIGALNETVVLGSKGFGTNQRFLVDLLESEDFQNGKIHVHWIEKNLLPQLKHEPQGSDLELVLAALTAPNTSNIKQVRGGEGVKRGKFPSPWELVKP